MIRATEALRLPSAELSADDRKGADALEAAIEAHIREHMERRGTEFQTKERRPNVIAEVSQRLKAAGWAPQWQAVIEQGRFSTNPQHTGFQVLLFPSDEAYRAVAGSAGAGVN